MGIRTIGVIGAGQMGSGIAYVMAASGYDVLLMDVSSAKLEASVSAISALVARNAVRTGDAIPDNDLTLTRIQTTTALAPVGSTDLVIEAASENEVVKTKIFDELVPHLSSHTILTTNTSSLSITRLAGRTPHPERFMGLHFMNPVPVMSLVELIRGIATNAETFTAVGDVVDRIGKKAVVAADYPAFIVNRILIPMINEAIYTLHEGVGSMSDIDKAMRLGVNHPMGPLELADFIGLDTCLAIMNTLHKGLADSKYRPCPLLVKYVEAGWLGRKVHRGFYDYRSGIASPSR